MRLHPLPGILLSLAVRMLGQGQEGSLTALQHLSFYPMKFTVDVPYLDTGEGYFPSDLG